MESVLSTIKDQLSQVLQRCQHLQDLKETTATVNNVQALETIPCATSIEELDINLANFPVNSNSIYVCKVFVFELAHNKQHALTYIS